MEHDRYAILADQRLKEMYEDAAMRRSIPRKPTRPLALRAAIGHALIRWGERLSRPAGSALAHR